MFQYKILSILFLNKLHFKFKKVTSPLSYFCDSADETLLHIFYTCNITNRLWNELQYFVSQYLYIAELHRMSSSDFLMSAIRDKIFILINHLLLIFRHYLYMSREHGTVCFTNLKLYLIKIKTTEQNISPCSSQKNEKCRRKWRVTKNVLI